MTRRPLQPRMSRLVRTTHSQTPSAKKNSESPITLYIPRSRRQAAGSIPCSVVEFGPLYPTIWADDYPESTYSNPPNPIGGGAHGMFGDQSDATYINIPTDYYTGKDIWVLGFPAVTLPPGKIEVDVSIRLRGHDITNMRWVMVYLQGWLIGSGGAYPEMVDDFDYWTRHDVGSTNLVEDEWVTITRTYVDDQPRDYETSLGIGGIREIIESGRLMMYAQPHDLSDSLATSFDWADCSVTVRVDTCDAPRYFWIDFSFAENYTMDAPGYVEISTPEWAYSDYHPIPQGLISAGQRMRTIWLPENMDNGTTSASYVYVNSGWDHTTNLDTLELYDGAYGWSDTGQIGELMQDPASPTHLIKTGGGVITP